MGGGTSTAPLDGQRPTDEEPRLVVVHAGGAILRSGASVTSPQVGKLRRGEVIPVVIEEGRRACVRTSEGARAWISTVAANGEPIVRRVTASTKYKAKDMPVEGTSAFADAFEKRWREKWQRLRVEADRKEGKPNTVRGSLAGMKINAWRPSKNHDAERVGGTIRPRPRMRSRQPPPPEPVPKLEQPASASTGLAIPPSQVSAVSGDIHQPLMDFDTLEEDGDLPDLMGFDTWPMAKGSKTKVPSLAELLGGRGGTTPGLARNMEDDFDEPEELGKNAVVFNTEPLPGAASRSKPLLTALPPRRGASLMDAAARIPEDAPLGSDAFEHLFKDHLEQQDIPESMGEELPGPSGSSHAGSDDLTAAEVLASFPETEAPLERDAPASPTRGFQIDTPAHSWAKRSVRKISAKFPRQSRGAMQASLDVEQFADAIGDSAVNDDAAEIPLAPAEVVSDSENGVGAIDDVIEEPSKGTRQTPLEIQSMTGDASVIRAPERASSVASRAAAALSDPRLRPSQPHAPDTPTREAPLSDPRLGLSPPRAPDAPVQTKASPPHFRGNPPDLAEGLPESQRQGAARHAEASPLSQGNLLNLATLPSEVVPEVAQNEVPDLTMNPFFDARILEQEVPDHAKPFSDHSESSRSETLAHPFSHTHLGGPSPAVPDLAKNQAFDVGAPISGVQDLAPNLSSDVDKQGRV